MTREEREKKVELVRKEKWSTRISSYEGIQIENLFFDEISQIHSFRKEDFNLFNHPNMGGWYGLYGIELTPEVLDQCDLLKSHDKLGRTYHIMNKVNTWFSDWTIREWKDGTYHFNGLGKAPLKYLHQLQNLYFALTGEELKIENLTV